MMDLKRIGHKKWLALIIAISIIATLAPAIAKSMFNPNILPGTSSYYDTRLVEELSKSGIQKMDVLAARPYTPSLYHLMLAFLGKLAGINVVSIIFPIIAGIASLILLDLLLKKWVETPWKRIVILFLFAVSPIFISTFATSNPHSLALPIILGSAVLLNQNSGWRKILGGLLLASLAFVGFFQAILALVLVLVYFLSAARHKLVLSLSLLAVAFSALIVAGLSLPMGIFSQSEPFANLLAAFGAELGFSAFGLFLAALGFFVSWKDKKRMLPLYLLLLFLIAGHWVFGSDVNPYLNLVTVLFSGIGFEFIYSAGWQVQRLKQLTAFLLVAGLLFSAYSFETELINSFPSAEMVEGLKFLHEDALTTDKVLSHYSNGFLIEYIAGLPPVLDSNFRQTPDFAERLNVSEAIFQSRNLMLTSRLFQQNNIKYVFITQEMRHGQVWTRENQGLLFLFRNNETFKKIYENNDVEIWKYVHEG